MRIWVDADACPAVIREIIFRAARRTGTPVTLVANQPIRVPRSALFNTLQVPGGFDAADDRIAEESGTGDLVVTADIPLAARVVEKGTLALNPRGELYTEANIRERLNLRDFMDELRGSGVQTGGPPPLGAREKHAFAAALDRLLAAR